MKPRKYDYLIVLQGNYGYGHGFEDLCAAEDTRDGKGRKEIRDNLKDYRTNEGGNYRIIRRREARQVAT